VSPFVGRFPLTISRSALTLLSVQRGNVAVQHSTAAAVYIRVSTEEQSKHGISLDVQLDRVLAYCQAAGLSVASVFREEGVSGAKPLSQRPAGSQLLRAIDRSQANHVVSLKLDRLFRDCEDALRQTRDWDRSGIALHLVDMGGQSMNTASAMGRMMLTMMAGFAELERNLIAERTTTAMRHLKTRKQVYCPTPYGFDRLDDKLIPKADEQAVVAEIIAMRSTGSTLVDIAANLNARGIRTKRRGSWTATTVRRILMNDLHQ
jgi:DNA invertase Pin-like site-specific DNA recombinase